MPLFAVVAGFLFRGVTVRHLDVLFIGILSAPMVSAVTGGGMPVLLVFFAAFILFSPLVNHPLLAAVLGICWATELPISWGGYEPGVLLAYLAIGRIWGTYWVTMPNVKGGILSWLGRYPLTFYFLHIAILFSVKEAFLK